MDRQVVSVRRSGSWGPPSAILECIPDIQYIPRVSIRWREKEFAVKVVLGAVMHGIRPTIWYKQPKLAAT